MRVQPLAIFVVSAVLYLFPGVDLTERYRATLNFGEQPRGCEWTCGPEDVWRLKEFDYALDDVFRIRLGPSQAVFGCHDSNVVWAAIFPEQPGEILAASPGKGDRVTSVWLRFHPSRLGELFPNAIVAGQGDASMVDQAKRLAAHKIIACWQSGGLPMIPMKTSITFDLETLEGPRRFYSLDTETRKLVAPVDAFRDRPLPIPKPLDSQAATVVFDKVWEAFDRQYAMFVIKPKVDWPKLRETYRPRAAAAKSNHELAAVISEMLDHLEDLHVYVEVDGQYMPGYNRDRPLNANAKATATLIGSLPRAGSDMNWGRTSDRVGYISIHRLVDTGLPDAFDDVLGRMGDTKGLILDLRFNGGGSEPLGKQIAGRFLDRRRVYSLSQFRSGPKHTDLGPKNPRSCEPDGPWHYGGPVVVLQGQVTMSSAESFALMLAQCPQVITLGDRTAGSSANPRLIDAGAGIVVNLPRWIDMDPQGNPIDAVGVPPRVKIETRPEDFTGDRDPVLTAALEDVRNRAKSAPAGNVLGPRPGALPVDRPKVVAVWPPDGASDVDPITEIRICFDRPMTPTAMMLSQSYREDLFADADCGGFRLRRTPRYVAEKREFVIPVTLKPGTKHRLEVQDEFWLRELSLPPHGFLSADGVSAAHFAWQFTTREPKSNPEASRPRPVSIDPPSGSETSVFTTVRIRFDRPMNPDCYELVDLTSERFPGDGTVGPFPAEYDPPSNTFTFHIFLPVSSKTRLELRGFRGADGSEADAVPIEYRAGKTLCSAEQETRIAAAGRSAHLRELVEAVRRKRLAMKSAEEHVRRIYLPGERPGWSTMMIMRGCRFAFQGQRQFYADVSGIMQMPFLVGSDGRQCWHVCEDRVITCPFEAIHEKDTRFCDPFGINRFRDAEETIRELRLEYLGVVEYEEKSCHRIRSWLDASPSSPVRGGMQDWLIDVKTLLPALHEAFSGMSSLRTEFTYKNIDEALAEETFQPPKRPDLKSQPLEPLREDRDHYFLDAHDGSDGHMSVHWGQYGKQGRDTSGLN